MKKTLTVKKKSVKIKEFIYKAIKLKEYLRAKVLQ